MNSRTADKAEQLARDVQANGAAEQERLKTFANRAERIVREGAEELRGRADEFRGRAREYADEFRGHARDYYDEAQDRFDVAQRYLVERVQERPVASTLVAVGVGVVLGMLLAGGRRR
ncbi:MAG TPA: DUF883 domain-containing protein [Caulobacteraceae bacterium]|jgi:ElaB/YqjD/DUF883 family membrane-anchored ribosome-binding protein|nr:DUF883 domain-containing protein [Caulobacteraceae bacterium]